MSDSLSRSAAVPFVFVRDQRVIGEEIVTTTEEIHGLVHLAGDRLRIQWRIGRSTQRIGAEIRTDRTVDRVAEVEVPVTALAGAEVRGRWWTRIGLPGGIELVLRAADLRAFEAVAGDSGLGLVHPAELVIPVRRADRLAAGEFAAELSLAIAEQTLPARQRAAALPSVDLM